MGYYLSHGEILVKEIDADGEQNDTEYIYKEIDTHSV